jgi:rare lipoprotein A
MSKACPNPPPPLIALAALAALALTAGCHHQQQQYYVPPPPPQYQPNHTAAARKPPAATPAGVTGKPLLTEVGLSSWYGPPYDQHPGANGEIYDQNAMTAAHRTLPLGSIVRVTNIATGQSVVVRITDRGPFVHGRVLDLSLAAAKAAGVYRAGVATVKIEVYSMPAPQTPGGRWCVQVGAFSSAGNALKLKDDLARRYTNAKVVEFPGPTGNWVRVTALPDKARAAEIAESIRPKEPSAEAYLVRLD